MTSQTVRGAHRLAGALLLSGILSGCMVGPKYRGPIAPVPPTFEGEHAPSTGAPSPQNWWQVFHDGPLTDSPDTYHTVQHTDTMGGKISLYLASLHRFFVIHTSSERAQEAGLQIFQAR